MPIYYLGMIVVFLVALAILAWIGNFLSAPAMLGGIGISFYAVLGVFLRFGEHQPATVTPNDVVAGRAGFSRSKENDPYPPDWAWPSYLVGQVLRDVRAAWTAGVDLNKNVREMARRTSQRFQSPRVLWAFIWLPWWVWFWVTLGELIGAAIIVVVLALVWTVCVVGWGLIALTLRAYGRVVRRLRRADASCPSCYYVMSLPGYRCDSCDALHRNLRPGVLGAAWRSCGCGRRLPTTARRAGRNLTSWCQRCDGPLREGAAVLTDVRIPVFGPMSAGKTRLVHAGLVALRDQLAARGGELGFVDAPSQRAFEFGEEIIGSCDDTAKTPAGQLPRAITVRASAGRHRALVHLFDAAGEFFTDREDNSRLEFLDHAGGLVLVVDPFSIPWVRDQLGGADDDRVAAAQPATEDPERGYRVTAERMRDYGVKTGRRAVAVAVVKADLLSEFDWASDLRAGQVRDWLVEVGMDNLVLAAERDFAEARFFVVSSMTGVRAGSGMSPAAPLLWLISRETPARLPGDERKLQEVA